MRPEPPYTLELLEDYVNGMLSESGRAHVERLISSDEEVALMIEGIQALKQSKGNTDSLRDLEKVIPNLHKQDSKPVRKLWPRIGWVAASIALLVVAGYFFMQNPALEDVLAQEVAKPYSLGLVVRGNQSEDVAQAFEASDFEKVYALGQAVPSVAMSPDVRVQVGIAALKTGRSEECVVLLDASIDENALLGPVNKWYRALALVSLQDDRAVPLLQEIKDSGSFGSSAASELLNAIERDWK